MRRVDRQNSFFRRYMAGGKTTRQVLDEMRLKPTTLQRWCEDPAFKKRFEAAVACLRLMAEGDAVVTGAAMAKTSASAGAATVEGDVKSTDVFPPLPSRARPTRGAQHDCDNGDEGDDDDDALSERDRLIEMNGPEAGPAYDRFVQMRREADAREAAAATARQNGGDADAVTPAGIVPHETEQQREACVAGAVD